MREKSADVRTRFIFVNRFFYPDHSATSQLLGDLAFYLADNGASVHVISSRQIYDKPDAALPLHEIVRGVTVHRVRTTGFGRRYLPGRVVDYISFYVTAAWKLFLLARSGDIVIPKTDPPLLSVLAAILAPSRGFATVNWFQDLYPEIAAKFGLVNLRRPFGKFLIYLRNRSLRRAALNVVIGEDMSRRLIQLGARTDRTVIRHNWSDEMAIRPQASDTALRSAWGLGNKFVVAYSGNLGRTHDLQTMLGAAERLREREDVAFLFVGGGQGMDTLQREVQRRGIENAHFQPYQPREYLSRSLAVADVHWLSLKPEFDGLILPSKFYGIAAAGRPIVVIGARKSELARLVESNACGVAVEISDDGGLAHCLRALASDPALCRTMGDRARVLVERHFSKEAALAHWQELLEAVAARTAAAAEIDIDDAPFVEQLFTARSSERLRDDLGGARQVAP